MESVIGFENVSKRYELGTRRSYVRYLLPDRLNEWVYKRSHANRNPGKPDELWALRGVTFEIEKGEMIGLIGPNGAGKTTALSLLAGVTSPTSGQIRVRGRMGALIKLGAGFHPDLSGRENVYLNGSILGLRRSEIARIYDGIVEFSELRDFMDTPVKRYSSGMYVRLGFSVAVHINPDILLLDEILSVGDVAFQTRCFNRIGEIRDQGKTIVFVSHNLHHISRFCDRVVYLNHGQVRKIGPPGDVLGLYTTDLMNRTQKGPDSDGSEMNQVNGTGRMVINRVAFLDKTGAEVDQIFCGDPLTVRVFYQCREEVENPVLDLVIRDASSGNLFQATNADFGVEFGRVSQDGYIDISFASIPSNNQLLNFFFTLWNSRHTEQYDWKRYIKLLVTGNPVSSGRVMFECEWRNFSCIPTEHEPVSEGQTTLSE